MKPSGKLIQAGSGNSSTRTAVDLEYACATTGGQKNANNRARFVAISKSKPIASVANDPNGARPIDCHHQRQRRRTGPPSPQTSAVKAIQIKKQPLKIALEREGISFIAEPEGGVGVRLDKKRHRG